MVVLARIPDLMRLAENTSAGIPIKDAIGPKKKKRGRPRKATWIDTLQKNFNEIANPTSI